MDVHNLLELLKRSVDRFPEKAAYLWKEQKEYRYMTYEDLWSEIKRTAEGLSYLGIERDDKVAIISNNRIHWPISDFAIGSLGAISVPVYPTLQPEQINLILRKSDCKVAIVENQELVQKINVNQTALEHLIVIDPGEWTSHQGSVLSFAHLLEIGARHPEPLWEETWKSLERDHVSTIIHTSGTTGQPKGAMLTHGNFISNIEGIQFWVLEARSDDVFLSYLPLSHVFERMAGQYLPLSVGATIAYAESLDTIQDNLLEVKPTIMTSVPRLFEKVYAKVIDQIESGSPVRQKIFNWALKVGHEKYQDYLSRSTDDLIFLNTSSRLYRKWKLADRLVYQKIKAKVGGRLRAMISGGAALNPDIAQFFWSIDLPIFEGYGLTETAPVIAVNPVLRAKIGSVGKPLPNLKVKLGDDGEVLVKGPSVMKGYYKNEEATAKAFVDGWYKTGDIGEMDEEGFLKIVDRKKNIIVLSTGKNVIPQPVESAVNQSAYVDQSLLIGQGRKYVILLVALDHDYLKQWAEKQNLSLSSTDQLIHQSELQTLIVKDIQKAISKFPRYEQPKKLVICPEIWSAETGELTPSLKVRLKEVEQNYRKAIMAAYDEEELLNEPIDQVILELESKHSETIA
ncbi:long-chain fatty acid--CoA ligase [Pullulanibacillus sp. KACC 23026]|uniref:AMP-dependent synthetase/ligase n=1 Tax=Pullulanibacillus sp. KACC 23026 TaxID=3028315 RepID=UPI0023B1EE5E|nr:long-chain fatty acid--CoA ligase [Pullulanibacillus sp. KACC 23026]WEG14662.1 long-chain fatty acid--CoA ligase [Pullulanibacillus sp. KACC 23026]